MAVMVHNQWSVDSSPQRFHFGGRGVHPCIAILVFLHPVNDACLLDHRGEAGPTSEVYTHLNCSIKPHETSSNPEKLSPDTLTARSRYTNQMDLGLESILHHQAAITLQAPHAGRAQNPVFVLSADTLGQGWRVPISCLASVYKCATKEERLLVFPSGFKTHIQLFVTSDK